MIWLIMELRMEEALQGGAIFPTLMFIFTAKLGKQPGICLVQLHWFIRNAVRNDQCKAEKVKERFKVKTNPRSLLT